MTCDANIWTSVDLSMTWKAIGTFPPSLNILMAWVDEFLGWGTARTCQARKASSSYLLPCWR